MESLKSLFESKNDLINQLLFITKKVQISSEDDIENYFNMVEERETLLSRVKELDKKISTLTISDEDLGFITSINSNITSNAKEIIDAEAILLEQIEKISEELKKEVKTIAQGKYTKSIYQKEFDLEPSKINKYT